MAVSILTDSGSDLTRAEAHRLGISIVPIWILFGSERLRDGIDIDGPTFYRRVAAGESVKTEPPSEAEYRAAMEAEIAKGNDVVAITLSSEISQSFAHASAAASAFAGKAFVVDSRGASGLESLYAMFAAERAAAGDGAAAIAERLRAMKSAAYFAVTDLTPLGKSGRLPKPVVALGSMLNVSLVLKMNEAGAIGLAGQSRSFDKTCEIMVDAVVRGIEHTPDAWVAFSHVQAIDTANTLRALLEKKLGHPARRELFGEATLTIAANMGNGAIGIFALVP